MKKVLVMNFFPAFVPPQSGGELRYYNMYLNLSRYYDVTLLSPTYSNHKQEVIEHSSSFREYRVPKENIHDQLHMKIAEEKICSEISALVCCIAAGTYNKYHELYQELYKDADVIIHESPYVLDYDIFFGLDNKLRIYNSYNFESKLVSQMWSGPNAQKYVSIIKDHEARLVQGCDLVFATSQEEKTAFMDAFQVSDERIRIAPNGIEVSLYEKLRQSRNINRRKKAFFIGSAHPPNMEAVNFITKELAPKCLTIDFYIAGKCCDNVFCDSSNVFLLGLIDNSQKDELFTTSDIAVNPMFSGAGTNLKTLEFLSAGIPMISTTVGVRGLNLIDNQHYIHAEKNEFAKVLLECIEDEQQLKNLAEQGKVFINNTYSWKSICDYVHSEMEKICSIYKNCAQQVIFAINDYPVDAPVAGGSVRIFNLLSVLSQSYQIIFLCLNNGNEVEIKHINSNFMHISVPKTEKHLAEEARVNSKHWISANDVVAGYMIHENSYYMQTVVNLYQLSNIIILNHPYLIDVLNGLDGKPVIHESQNFEYKLKAQLLAQHPLGEKLIDEVKHFEERALDKADLVISVSRDEVEALKNFSPRKNVTIEVINNGVSIVAPCHNYQALKSYLNNRPIAIFVGSGHTPNVEAASYILQELAPQKPECLFAIVGSVCGAFSNVEIPDNVLLFGMLSEEHKNFILFSSDIALNPIMEGAGSNLKLAEYFAFRIPTITTNFGARGYSIENGNEAIICSREDFAFEMQRIIDNKVDFKAMTDAAFLYVQQELSWGVLAEQYKSHIESLLHKKRALLITYRYNRPTRGGAEVYVSNVLSRIADRGNYQVDVATTDIGDIMEKFRFSSEYTKDDNVYVETAQNFKCYKFPVDVINESIQWKQCKEIYACFMQESLEISRNFFGQYQQPILMGGWHYPESTSEGLQVWNSGNAEIFIQGVKSIRILGYTPKRVEVALLIDGKAVKTEKISGDFDLSLGAVSGKVLTMNSNAFYVENKDPRPLSLRITEITYQTEDTSGTIDLNDDYKAVLKRVCSSDYVQSMINVAMQRSDDINKRFYTCRGPNSKALEDWLDKNIKNYDVIIGHSVPFNTSILAGKYALKYNMPILQLPHFHMEDDFYHWKDYYEMMATADCVLASPKATIPVFYDKINAKSKFIQGGGVVKEEFDKIDTAEFDQQYPSDDQFVLVLGRKAGAKNYRWVIDAVEKVNQTGSKIQLVIIGRDEDRAKVNSKTATYLGEQSRKAVLGALKRCSFVINMSGSESFGIVILEAWLAGKPIIVNQDCAAFAELVNDGVNGLLATQDNLQEKIVELLHGARIEEMGQAGMEKAQDEFTWNSISKKIEDVLNKMISS